MNQQIQEALNVLLTTVITGVIGIIGALISVYLNKLKDKAIASANAIKDDSTKKLVQNIWAVFKQFYSFSNCVF